MQQQHPKTVELRKIKKGGHFRLPGSGSVYARGEYDREARAYYAREFGYSDQWKFPASTRVEVAA